jgi:hypothetical protein
VTGSGLDGQELLEAVFSMRSVPRLYSEDQREKSVK